MFKGKRAIMLRLLPGEEAVVEEEVVMKMSSKTLHVSTKVETEDLMLTLMTQP